MKNLLLVFITMVFIVSCTTTSGTGEQSNLTPLPVIIDDSKAIALFNGKDLNGWKIHGTEKWYVDNGLLVCENGPDETFGYLATLKHYKDFQLTLEYKQKKRGNSGIFVHANVDGNQASGWQIEIAPPGHSTGGINASPRGWLAEPDYAKDEVIKMGEWNVMTVIVKGNMLTSWLNGTHMATINDAKLSESEGGIALQLHGENETEIQWRNIKLIEL